MRALGVQRQGLQAGLVFTFSVYVVVGDKGGGVGGWGVMK